MNVWSLPQMIPERLLITGGTGSLGQALCHTILEHYPVSRIAILSRDELKQAQMAERFQDPRLRFFLGDVRDESRLSEAFDDTDAVIHAAALKRVDAIAYNPDEAVKTNVLGTKHVITAARHAGVKHVLLVSTDKSVHPANFYGATKMLAEQIAINSNVITYPQGLSVSAVRYGNVWGSRGSVVQLWKTATSTGSPIQVTDPTCTRFLITLEQAASFVLNALTQMQGGEIFVPKLPATSVRNLAEQFGPASTWTVTGLRPGGEKQHEQLIGDEEITRTYDVGWSYLIAPSVCSWTSPQWPGEKVPSHFEYHSDTANKIQPNELADWIGCVPV